MDGGGGVRHERGHEEADERSGGRGLRRRT